MIGPSPVHVPGAAVSVPPSTAVPVGAGGGVVLTGAAGRVGSLGSEAVGAEVAPGFVAVTTTTIGCPTSAAVGE